MLVQVDCGASAAQEIRACPALSTGGQASTLPVAAVIAVCV